MKNLIFIMLGFIFLVSIISCNNSGQNNKSLSKQDSVYIDSIKKLNEIYSGYKFIYLVNCNEDTVSVKIVTYSSSQRPYSINIEMEKDGNRPYLINIPGDGNHPFFFIGDGQDYTPLEVDKEYNGLEVGNIKFEYVKVHIGDYPAKCDTTQSGNANKVRPMAAYTLEMR